MKYIFVWLVLFTLSTVFSKDITTDVFSDNVDGLISAFGDFNGDGLTDVFFITENGKQIEIYIANARCPYLRKSVIYNFTDSNFNITSSVPGDYDGDSQMDVLVTLRNQTDYSLMFKILWGNKSSLEVNDTGQSNQMLKDQPLILDYNSDGIPDVYGELPNGSRCIWISFNRTFQRQYINTPNHVRVPHSNAFVDLTNDLVADIFVTIENNSFEIWNNMNGYFENYQNSSFPFSDARLGQSAFLDMNLDGKLDHIVPVCFNTDCTNSSIFIYHSVSSNKALFKWSILHSFQYDNNWGFVNDSDLPITLRIGDYDLDGYPDVVAVLYNNTSSAQKIKRAVLLKNVECTNCLDYERQLKPQWDLLSDLNNISQVAFYDVLQNGALDFLLVEENQIDGKIKRNVRAIQNTNENDYCFIKVLVSSGMCSPTSCSSDGNIHDVNYPGSIVHYSMIRPDGMPQNSSASQLSQSAYFALQIPYTIFGLGPTPNFVDKLVVGSPSRSDDENYNNSWYSIIPNSRMMVLALKENQTSRSIHTIHWSIKLYMTPSHNMLMTFVALITTCVVVALVIGGLYWKEKVADKREKLQEAHRFHFDAM